jgi:hypothetical protein
MDFTAMNHSILPATGKTVAFPNSQWVFTVEEGKITQEELITPPSPDTGLAGLLKAFGLS